MPGIAFHIAIGLTLAATPTAGGPMPVEKCMATGLIQEAICTVSIPMCGANFTVEIPKEPATNCKISKKNYQNVVIKKPFALHL